VNWRMPAFARTTAFRLTLMAAGLFAVSSFVILALVYAYSVGAASRRADATIGQEVAAVEKRFAEGGPGLANRYILQRSVGGSEFLYLLVGPDGERMTGNISALPAVAPDEDGRIRFTYDRAPVDDEDGQTDTATGREARGRIAALPDGYALFVGLDVQEETRLVAGLLNAILVASGLALAFGIVSGVLVSRRFAARLESINAAARQVMTGKFATRAPRTHSGDDLDDLARHFNDMLDRVEHLMHRMRTAGDSIAHDLRLPLTRMRSRLETALVEGADKTDYEAALAQAVSDTDELLKTFNAVLSLTRLQTGERRQAFQTLDPAELLSDIAELYEPVCEDAGLEFSSELASGLTILGDRELIAQLVANLIDNAVKYAPAGEAICLRVRETGSGAVEISVTDTGPGIPAEDRVRVLERFVRLEESRNQPGVGLGLSLVQAIAEVHSAALSLDDGPGTDGAPGLRVALVFPQVK
jgi:signal transduction histidine kinase